MTLENVTVINGKAAKIIKENKNNSFIVEHNGRTKTLYTKKSRLVENHITKGRFVSIKVRRA